MSEAGRGFGAIVAIGFRVGMIILACSHSAARAADLLDIYQQAQLNDPTFEAARHQLAALREKTPQAVAGNLPTVNLSASDTYTGYGSSFNGGARTRQGVHAWSWTLQLTQPLMDPQKVIAYSEAEAQVAAAEAEFAQAEQDLILQVAQAYFDVLAAQESIAAAEVQLRAMEEQGDAARRGYELGTMSITDSDEARAKAAMARAEWIAAQNELENKLAELEKLTGQSSATLDALKPEMVLPKPVPDDPGNWIAQSKDNNPVVRAQIASLKAAGYTIAKARAENVWTLDLVASYGSNYSSGNATTPFGFESRVKSNMAGLQFSMPIFAGGLNRSHMREAVENRDILAAKLEESRRKAGAEARQAYSGVVSGLSQVVALQSAVESGESAVKGNQAGYRLGIKMNIDVLNAEQQLYTSRRDLVKARYDVLLQGFRLKAAAGILSESDLLEINELLIDNK